MAKDSWQVYQDRLNRSGITPKDRLITNAQRVINNQFTNSPSYQIVTINGVSQEVQIIEENILYKDSNKKRLLCKPSETISVGDIIVWNSENWLCTDTDNIEVYKKGIIEKCDDNLLYLDSAGELVTVPCVVNDRILMNVEENRYYILPDNQVWVVVGDNDDSAAIAEDMRFLLGGKAYKVVAIDNITRNGLITFKMHFDSIVEDDNTALGIANYTSRLHTYMITILNGASMEITLGDNLQLQVECTDNDEVVTSPDITYSLATGATGIVSVSTSGLISADTLGSGTIVATYNEETDSINVDVVAGVVENFVYSLVGNIQPDNEVKYNQTKNYVATKKYSTGTEVTGSMFEFSIVLGTGASSSNYLLTTSSDTQCALKGLQYPYSISLVATDQDIPANSVAKAISLKGLL